MSKSFIKPTSIPIHCTWCGQTTTIIWVHGHGQCRICRTNIDECCRGESEAGMCKEQPK